VRQTIRGSGENTRGTHPWALRLWILRAAAFCGLLLAALMPSVALFTTIVMGCALVGVIMFGISGLFTKRLAAATVCAWVFALALAANILGMFVLIEIQKGDEQTARQLVAALDRYRGATGTFPASLEALVPEYVSALPPTPWGQRTSRYLYRKENDQFRLAYSVGFNAYRSYDSRTKKWKVQE
jgi:hypothetical protein